jgi:hypothetical protein
MIKKMIIITALLTLSLPAFCPADRSLTIFASEPIVPYESLWKAVCEVESNNNPLAYNSHEGAVGIAQIRLCRIRDYNRRTGSHLPLNAMFDPLKSKEVFMYFCEGDDLEKIAKAWNGSGKKTKIYWNKVKQKLYNE